ncbi:intercellular adhesion molecule 3 isoform X4 [Sapajus apella]|uniref:Intercellular adhesion molecule 3 n=1 Tax=Sapajus apella TaxID=9515 RepID=A0A6J3FQ38_SAPAP|nr:intercellular adhesion molecule 3 isoform X4 [Sapajus apella]
MATMIPAVSWLRACWTLLVCCLLTPGVQGQEFLLRVEPQNPVLPAGGSLLVNCSTDCPSAKQVTLETSLSKELVDNGTGWAAFWVSNVTGNSRILCSGYCNGLQIIGSTDITVYRLPERVELAPLPPWQPVGQNLTLHCQVEGGSPRTSLTVVLLRWEEELSRQPAVEELTEVTATVLASRGDHGAHFSCRTELDLRLQGLRLLVNTSAPRRLRTFALPVTPPRLVAPRFLEVETSCPVDCTVEGLFPASEAQVHLALGDQVLNETVTNHGDMLTATATATARADQEGARQIICNVTLGGERLEARENLTVFNGPQIDRAKCPQHLKWKDKTRQVLQCHARGNPSPQLRCLKEGSSQEVPVGIPFLVNVTHNGTYQCQAVSSRGKYTLVVVINIEARNSHFVPVLLAVFTTLGVVTVVVALMYVFRARKQRGLYHVRQESPSLPLTSMPTEAIREEPSRVE